MTAPAVVMVENLSCRRDVFSSKAVYSGLRDGQQLQAPVWGLAVSVDFFIRVQLINMLTFSDLPADTLMLRCQLCLDERPAPVHAKRAPK